MLQGRVKVRGFLVLLVFTAISVTIIVINIKNPTHRYFKASLISRKAELKHKPVYANSTEQWNNSTTSVPVYFTTQNISKQYGGSIDTLSLGRIIESMEATKSTNSMVTKGYTRVFSENKSPTNHATRSTMVPDRELEQTTFTGIKGNSKVQSYPNESNKVSSHTAPSATDYVRTKNRPRKSCRKQQFDPFDKSVLPFIQKLGELDCSPETDRISEINDEGFLVLHGDRLKKLVFSLVGSKTEAYCSCMSVVRHNDHSRIMSDVRHLVPDKPLKVSSDFTKVICHVNQTKLVYMDIHATISTKRAVTSKQLKQSQGVFSVLMIGFDGMSRANTIRQMPKTYGYVTNVMGSVTMTGYNAVGDNSYPNLVALLCGKNGTEIPRTKARMPLNFPFVWKEFSKQNYTTLYSEDEMYATFNYHTTGFTKSPTDYYQRPFWEERDAIIKKRKKAGLKGFKSHCFNGRSHHAMMHDWTMRFITKFQDFPYFAFTFLNDLSHSSLNDVQLADEYYFKFFKTLHENGFLKQTLTMFLSDHGNRYSSIRGTPIGRAEHSLPLMTIFFPEDFRTSYPEAFNAVQYNSNRLTTPYDVHETLLDVITKNFTTRHYPQDKRGRSLFGKIPDDRECQTCGVPDEFCQCEEQYEISIKSKRATLAVSVALRQLAIYLQPQRGKCETLKLNRVHSAFQLSKKETTFQWTTHLVIFETLPGKALFEANVRLPLDLDSDDWAKKAHVIGDVGRINEYGNQSACTNDNHLRLYCYCKGSQEDRENS